MITNKIHPSHIVRLYVWALMEQETGMQKVPYTNPVTGQSTQLIPVIPVEDEPKLSNSAQPYIIYGFAENESGGTEQIHEGALALRIITPGFALMGQYIGVLSRAFESSDIATEAVNKFSSTYPGGILEGIRFTHIKATYVEGGEPSETEDGPMEGVVSLTYRYINRLPIPIPNSAKGGLWS